MSCSYCPVVYFSLSLAAARTILAATSKRLEKMTHAARPTCESLSWNNEAPAPGKSRTNCLRKTFAGAVHNADVYTLFWRVSLVVFWLQDTAIFSKRWYLYPFRRNTPRMGGRPPPWLVVLRRSSVLPWIQTYASTFSLALPIRHPFTICTRSTETELHVRSNAAMGNSSTHMIMTEGAYATIWLSVLVETDHHIPTET